MLENIEFNRITNAAEKVIARHKYMMEMERISIAASNLPVGDLYSRIRLVGSMIAATYAFKNKMMAISGWPKKSSSSSVLTVKALDSNEVFDVKHLTDALNSYKVTIN